MVFLSCTSCLPTVVEPKHQPNAISATENGRLAFESIIAVHNTYFIVLIAALSVYFGLVGVCWKFAFGTNHEVHLPRPVQALLLSIPFLVGFAIFKGMQYALGICAKHQDYLNNLAVKLDICSIDLSLLPYSARVSMVVLGILSVVSLILCLYVLLPCVWKCVKVVKVILALWVRHLMGK